MAYQSYFKQRLLPLAVISACSFSQIALADELADKNISVSPVVVTATRTEQNSFDLPVAIDVVKQTNIDDGKLQMTLSESLNRVPGITAQSRTQQAQDPQVSSRGFGSRSSFGVRGVRLYVDGIPLTMPDGQGQPGVVDLSTIGSIEVMRGPFSAMYGNSSGGVIQMLTKNAPKTPEINASMMFGTNKTQREVLGLSGKAENLDYLLNVSNFESDGYRAHSTGHKAQGTAKFKIDISENTKLTTLINWFDQKAQDPLGLARNNVGEPSAFKNPQAAVAAATSANTRVERSHEQVGFDLEHAFNENNSINLMTYIGNRDNMQILATNASGTNARNSTIYRDFYGADLHWNNKGNIFEKPYTLTAGLTYGKSVDDRLDTNVLANGSVINTLNRKEYDISRNFDQYIQAKLSILNNLDIHAGVRHTDVNLDVQDKFITGTGANGNNSGTVEYKKTTPVIGALWKVTPAFNLYANYGKGFETPTFVEMAYATSGANSLPNFALKPSRSNNYEVGAKAFLGENTQANLTLFTTNTNDEIVIQDNISGRVSYANANKTKRQGAELSVTSELPYNFTLHGAFTLLDAKFDSSYTNKLGTKINAGNIIPGTYHDQVYGEVAWRHPASGFHAAFEGVHNSRVYVDDVNSDTAPAYTIFNLRAGLEQKLAHWNFSEYVTVENMFDKAYIGSVRVNDGNTRFFEPAAGRTYLLSLNAKYKF